MESQWGQNHAGECEELCDRMKMTEILFCGSKKADHRIRNSEKLNDLGNIPLISCSLALVPARDFWYVALKKIENLAGSITKKYITRARLSLLFFSPATLSLAVLRVTIHSKRPH